MRVGVSNKLPSLRLIEIENPLTIAVSSQCFGEMQSARFIQLPSMIIGFQKKFLFIHIPKCAGDSVRELLLDPANGGAQFLRAFAALRAPCKRDQAWMAAFALMGLIAYIGASCFDFPLERINQQVYLAVLLSILVVAPRPAVPAKKSPPLWIPAAITSARQARTPWKTLDPVATPVSFLEGYAVLKTGDARSAIQLLEQARRENPNRLYILQNLAAAYLAAGRKADAIECLELTTRRYPQDAPTRAALERARAAQ
jgi:tetratricopeptide (TPR) repeat protein